MAIRSTALATAGILMGSLFGALQPAAAGTTAEAARAGDPQRTLTTRWSSNAHFGAGRREGVSARNGALRVARPKRTITVPDPYGAMGNRRFEWSRWTSSWRSFHFEASNLIPSWNARTPGRTFIRIEARTRSGSATSSWDRIADWGIANSAIHRASGTSQADDLNRLLTDTLISNGQGFRGYQLRVTLFRPAGRRITPVVRSVGAVAASYTSRSQRVSRTTMSRHRELRVPRLSQMTHAGHYPQWGSGGRAWCSPTSTAMVLRHFGSGPKPGAYRWTGERDGMVDHAARYTYDHRYEGTGNWPFNTAYAGHFGMDAYVTRLRNLRDAEQFIRAGIPVVISLAFDRGELDGAPISSTNGHLMVIVGFRKDGAVIANDPAAPRNRTVRRVYKRGQLERAWLSASGGVTYVIRPEGTPLPGPSNRW